MIDWRLYHGTSEAAYGSIKRNGFVLGDHCFLGWLNTTGVYCVCGRPLIAKRFAEREAQRDRSKPVVLEVPVRIPDSDRILNLTTDEGMNLLFESYEENWRLFTNGATVDQSQGLPRNQSQRPHRSLYFGRGVYTA
jgi:hypothetical protein